MDTSVPRGRLQGRIAPPCSKSYAQRALALALLAEGTSVLRNIEFCDDTLSAMHCIETLGARVQRIDRSTLAVTGGTAPDAHVLHVGESGLATRLFTPIAALRSTPVIIEGRGTLLHRPMSMMAEPLRTLGVDVRDGGGYLPIEVCGPLRGGEIDVDGSLSSQFVTGLLLALPMASDDTTMRVHGAVSTPYIDMTVDTVERFGGRILHNDYSEFFIEGGQQYRAADFNIEGDWSAAAMLLVAGAVAGEVTVDNISSLSKQADTAVCRALVRAGASLISEERSVTAARRDLTAFEFDATECPDLFPALVALAAAAEGTSTIIGTSRLEYKESHRAETLKEEYAKLGIEIDTNTENIMRVRGGEIRAARTESHNDHRIAMSIAVSALRCKDERGVIIEGAEAVAKSYPTFFEDLKALRVK
ncbi:MAG: 3-phosphoshikimate 1-carboxyvinyltransferase [Alistipes sp.]|nr:3-phosphoshikimate 1-carboxyvinyltransferase [Alistipes sp.]